MTLKPCPLCGGEAKTEWVEEFYYCLSHVQCTACAARGPRSSNEAVAEEAWNARVIPDGYVKVVRCGECKWWRRCDCPECRKSKSPIMACGNPDIIDISVRGEFDYCSAGEAKEDTNA